MYLQTDRFTTHPSENRIGTRGKESSHYHSKDNAIMEKANSKMTQELPVSWS